MGKKILLIDHDSGFPSLPLMKLSTYHKQLGDDVFLNHCYGKADFAYISKIFRASPRIKYRGPCSIGGTGQRDLSKKLPEEIEHLRPDYSLYGSVVAAGFTSRGCIRKCGFCYVPKKEGSWHSVADIYEFWEPGQRYIRIYDNSIFANKDHFFKITEQIIKEGLIWDICQGVDIRLLDDDIGVRLGEMLKTSCSNIVRFAFDDVNQAELVIEKVKLLSKYVPTSRTFSYVLTGFNSTYEDDLKRVQILRKLGTRPFVMVFDRKRYSDLYDTELLLCFSQWARAYHFKNCTFEEYLIAGGRPHLLALIGKEVHVNPITGPREDGSERKLGRPLVRQRYSAVKNIWGGVW
jgi:hypothetical protein